MDTATDPTTTLGRRSLLAALVTAAAALVALPARLLGRPLHLRTAGKHPAVSAHPHPDAVPRRTGGSPTHG